MREMIMKMVKEQDSLPKSGELDSEFKSTTSQFLFEIGECSPKSEVIKDMA